MVGWLVRAEVKQSLSVSGSASL